MTWLHNYLARPDLGWEIVGWIGQTLFFGRFFLQWLASERKKQSVIPFHFWTLSILGSALLLVYVFHKQSVPLIVGQVAGIFIYTRNILLIKRKPA